MKQKDKQALVELKQRIKQEFPKANFILFGSKLTGQDNEFSDIDVLVLLDRQIDTLLERRIFNLGFEVGLKYNVVFGIIVEEKTFWNSDLAKAMPLYQNVAKQGLMI